MFLRGKKDWVSMITERIPTEVLPYMGTSSVTVSRQEMVKSAALRVVSISQ